ncbi:MAG: phosphate ABC transporter permease PstA [Wenzhouxiangellaceae bacterium]|nr:phosphate ABC transporter permease PstA [Wenzhouxiangellaceae bacterium]
MRHRWRDRLLTTLLWLSIAVLLAALGWLLADLVWRGWPGLSWSFLLDAPRDAGRAGGIGSILVATGLILLVALGTALPLGLGSAIWLNEYTRAGSRAGRWTRLSLDILAGVPSIVFGLFGYAFFGLFLGLGYSILSGGLTLACMILPILIRTIEQGLAAQGDDWRQAGAALGMSRASLLWQVLLPVSAPAIATGTLLGMGRASAETAALLFTSGYVDRMPEALSDSGRALSVHIYDLAMNVSGGDAAAYSAALVLIVLIVFINGLTLGASQVWMRKRVSYGYY